MGTRARVNIVDNGLTLVSIYRQYDGYPSGLGADIKEAVGRKTIVNGIGEKTNDIANGMGCLSAQLIKALKEDVGNVYIRDTGLDSQGEEYIYILYEKAGALYMRVSSGAMTAFGCPGDTEEEMKSIYDGKLSEFDPENVEQ